MADINKAINKLVQALNVNGEKILYSKKQFMGVEGIPHNLYVISKAVWDDNRKRYTSQEVYKSTSTVRIALYLRDMWFIHNGWELPTDNEIWNKMREANKDG